MKQSDWYRLAACLMVSAVASLYLLGTMNPVGMLIIFSACLWIMFAKNSSLGDTGEVPDESA